MDTSCSVTDCYLQVPEDFPCIIVAHEFLDALPVHIFRKDPQRGWLEVLVDEPPASSGERVCSLVSLSTETAHSAYIGDQLLAAPTCTAEIVAINFMHVLAVSFQGNN